MYLPVKLETDLHLPRRVAQRVDEPEIGAAEIGVRRAPDHAVEQVERLERRSISRPAALMDFPTLRFSVRFQKRRTSPLMRGALPSSPTG